MALAVVVVVMLATIGCRTRPSPVDAAASASAAASSSSLEPARAPTSRVAKVQADDTVEMLLDLPRSLHGEKLMGLVEIEHGDLCAVGFQYTGAPGPDTGTIWRLAGGEWRVELTRSGEELRATWAAGPKDAYAVGRSIVVHYDGKGWTDQRVPGLVRGDAIWGSGPDDVYVIGVAGPGTDPEHPMAPRSIFHRKKGSWTLEHKTLIPLRSIHGTAANDVWVGGHGQLAHSSGDGDWKYDQPTRPTEIFRVSAVARNEIYFAGADLYRCWGLGGAWDQVRVDPAIEDAREVRTTLGRTVIDVAGRAPGDVYVISVGAKVAHLAGGTWRRIATPPGREATALTVTPTAAYVLFK